jgi:hypothetical protein
MSVVHQGFKFECDVRYMSGTTPCCEPFKSDAETERTAIAHAREANWAIVTIRVTRGLPKSKTRSVRRVACPACRWVFEG